MTEDQVRAVVRAEVGRLVTTPFRLCAQAWAWAGSHGKVLRGALTLVLVAGGVYMVPRGYATSASMLGRVTTYVHRDWMHFDRVLAQTMDSVPTYLFVGRFAFDSSAKESQAIISLPFFALRSQRVLVQLAIQHIPSDSRHTAVLLKAGPLMPIGQLALDSVYAEALPRNVCFAIHLDSLNAEPGNRLWQLVIQREHLTDHARPVTVLGTVVIQAVGPPEEFWGARDSLYPSQGGRCPAA